MRNRCQTSPTRAETPVTGNAGSTTPSGGEPVSSCHSCILLLKREDRLSAVRHLEVALADHPSHPSHDARLPSPLERVPARTVRPTLDQDRTIRINRSELTLLRTRGIVDLFLRGGVNAPGDGYFGAVGIAIASDQAFTAGVASLPTLLSEASANVWLWHQYLSVHGEATDVGEASSNQRM